MVKLEQQRSRASTQSDTRTPKTSWLTAMKMAVSSSSTLMVPLLMFASLHMRFCQVDLFRSLQIDQLQQFTQALKRESSTWWALWSFSKTISLKMRITKRFRKLFSSGSWILKEMLNSRITFKTNPRLASTNTFLISLHLLTVSALAFRSPTTCQRTSQLFSTIVCTNSTPTLCLKPSTFSRFWTSSTSHSLWFLLSLRPLCPNYRQQHSYLALKTCPHQTSTCTTWTSSLQVKRSKWRNWRTSARTRKWSTTSRNAAIFWAWPITLKIPTTPKPFCTTFFKRLSSTRAPTSHEAEIPVSMAEVVQRKTMYRMLRLRTVLPRIVSLIFPNFRCCE